MTDEVVKQAGRRDRRVPAAVQGVICRVRPSLRGPRLRDRVGLEDSAAPYGKTNGQPPCPREAPQGDPQHPQDHADDGADRHGAVQEGAWTARPRRRRTPARSPRLAADLSENAGDVSHPLLVTRPVKKTLLLVLTVQPRPVRRLQRQHPPRGDRRGPRVQANGDVPFDLEVSGKRGIAFFRFQGIPRPTGVHAVRGQADVRRGGGDRRPVHRAVRRRADRPGRRSRT